MTRRYRKYREEDNDPERFLVCVTLLYILYLFAQYYSNRDNFWHWVWYGLAFFILTIPAIIIFNRLKEKIHQRKKDKIINDIEKAGLAEYTNSFITRFGLGQERSRDLWQYRNYSIDWNRIHELQDDFADKGVKLSDSKINIVLRHYIAKREHDFMSKSIGVRKYDFEKLSGSQFEKILYRLYTVMGYAVQLNGKVGDQGGDLIAVKDQERLLIQAKCYKEWNVGNKAVQEAVAAKNHYDCNKAAVITTSNFTREATELAKTNNVELISKQLLQKMILDNLKESWS